MRKFTSKRSALLAIAGVLCISAAAVAYWTSAGGGSGTGTTGTSAATDFTIVDQAVNAVALVPGGPSSTIGASVKNEAANGASLAPQTVVATITGTNKANCDATDYEFVSSPDWAASGSGLDVSTYQFPTHSNINAGGKLALPAMPIKMINKPAANQDACKGATVNISYVVS